MKPYVWPSADEAPPVSARRTFPRQFRANHGTLNLFAPSSTSAAGAAVAAAEPVTAADGSTRRTGPHTRSSSSPITGQRSLHYSNHNRESTATQEFPTKALRRVPPPTRSETPHGIRHVCGAAGAHQQLQVVNITPAYQDPAQMAPVRTGVRCTPRKGDSSEVEAALAYTGTRQQLSARVLHAPVGRAALASPFTVDYSRQEKFAQAVRDHAQQRSRGVAEFYVQLVRNAVGGVTSSTPVPVAVPWSLEAVPPRRVLTLRRCRDQLVALTAIPVTLEELALLLWSSQSDAASMGDALDEKVVLFRDFAATFGQNSNDGRLAQMKI